jgi:hypothetical protein
VLGFLHIVVGVVGELIAWVGLALRPRKSLEAEILFLRRQLAQYVERGAKPRRIDPVTRVFLAVLSRFFDWRDALVVVRPETLMRWHRAGWRLFWRLKSRRGRPPIPKPVQALIRRMGSENPTWGEERIANELLLKLGIQVSPRTVRKYLHSRPPGQPRGDLRWSTFLRLHAEGIIACDFAVVVTATFRMLYLFVVIEHRSRRLIHFSHGPSNIRLDAAAITRSHWIRESMPTPNPRSRQHIRRASGCIDRKARCQRLEISSALPTGELHLRTTHRYHPSRVFGLVDSAVRVASAVDPEFLGLSLQHRPSTYGPGARCARSADGTS